MSGLLLRSFRDGHTLPFSPPEVLGDTGETLRNQALRGRFVDEGKGPGVVRGVVVDAFVEGGPVTSIVDPDGGNITYWGGRGMLLGSDKRESVRVAGRHLCYTAASLQAHFRPFRRLLPGFPYPSPTHVRFYVTTDDGLLVADAALADLATLGHPLSSLWSAAERARVPRRWTHPGRDR